MIRSLQRELAFGDQVGRYRLIAELARGGMGIVYLAATRGPAGFNKLHALKQLHPDLVDDASFLTMFLDEARVAARLGHPNIVQTNDVEQSEGRYFIAMEYLDGRSLSQTNRRLARKEGLPLHLALLVMRDVLNALDYAHSFNVDGASCGVVHRDISPQNIFITFDGCAKVIDFGIAKAQDSLIETRTGVLKGKACYMAPEQLSQRAEPRSDLFAAGAVLFELLARRRLWAGMTEVEVMGRLARGEVPVVPAELPGVPAALVDLCRTSLRPRVDDRYASAAQMRDIIDDYLWSARAAPLGRELGALLAAEFGPEREATRRAVEAHLAIEIGAEARPLLALPSEPPAEPGSVGASRVAGTPPPSSAAAPASASEIVASLQVPGVWKLGVAGALAVMLLGVLIGLGVKGGSAAPAAELARAPVPPAAAALPAAAPRSMISFSVTVFPSTARVFVDGDPIPSNPFLGRFPKDEAVHRLRATAPGFFAKERIVSFADNVMVDLSLDPKAAPLVVGPPSRRREPPRRAAAAPPPEPLPPHAPPAPLATAPAPPAHATTATDIAPRRPGDPAPRRAIDPSNPYGEDQ